AQVRAGLLGTEPFKVTEEQDSSVIFAQAVEGMGDSLAALSAVECAERPARLGVRQRRRLAFLGREMVSQVADAVVDNPAQPAEESRVVRVVEARKRLVRRQIGLLEHVAALDLLAEPR